MQAPSETQEQLGAMLSLSRQTVNRLLVPGGVLMIFYGFTAGNTLTISVVHSLNIDRYSTNLLVFCAPALVGTLVWLAEFFLALRPRAN